MTYRSSRQLPDLAEGLIRACYAHYGQELVVIARKPVPGRSRRRPVRADHHARRDERRGGRLLLRRAERERAARKHAEKFIEDRSRELYLKDQELERKNQELTLAEGALRLERDFVTGVIDAAQAVVLVVDGDGRIVRGNAFAATIAGIARHARSSGSTPRPSSSRPRPGRPPRP